MHGEKPYREFKSRPDEAFQENVREHVRKTAQPETHPDLFTGRIDPKEPFRDLCSITIDQHRRPDRDRAPCPMCAPNKFLKGRLCWFTEKHFAAVIGHCCADKENEAASRALDIRDEEEGYLLSTLPLTPRKLSIIEALLPQAHEADRLFNKFKSDSRELHAELRQIRKVNGDLTVYVETERPRDSIGPAAFGGSNIERQAVPFGRLEGTSLFASKLNLVEQLMNVKRLLQKGLETEDEALIFEYIIALSEIPSSRKALCDELREADRLYQDALEGLSEIASFFRKENLERLHAWGSHPANPLGLTVRLDDRHGVTAVAIESRVGTSRLSPAAVLFAPFEEWPRP